MRKILLPMMLVLLSAMPSFSQNTWNSSSTSTATTNGNIVTTNGNIEVTNGKLGIGTSSPGSKLEVKETNSSFVGSDILINRSSSTGSVGSAAALQFNDTGSGSYNIIQGSSSGLQFFNYYGGVGGWVERMKISGYGIVSMAQLDASISDLNASTAVNGYSLSGWGGDFSGAIGITAYGSNGTAGNFDGNVYADNYYTPSDRKFKENVNEIKGALDIIKLLKPKSYYFKTEEFKSKGFSKEKSVGFIAQEIQEVLPELVSKKVSVTKKDAEGKIIKGQEESLALNYIGFIPYIVSAIQEQQKTIENQSKAIENLIRQLEDANKRLGIEDAEKGKPIRLYQNSPNPFDQATTIKYSLSGEHKNANIFVYNLNGEQIKQFKLTSKGEGKIDINGGELKAGMYIYSLIVDGKEIETKRMILTK